MSDLIGKIMKENNMCEADILNIALIIMATGLVVLFVAVVLFAIWAMVKIIKTS